MPQTCLQSKQLSLQAKTSSPFASPIRVSMLFSFYCMLSPALGSGGGLFIPQIKSPSDLFSFSHIRNATRLEDSRLGALRTASSRSQGLRATVDEQLNVMARKESTTDEAPDRSAPHPRIGIGLPMSNIYATYVHPVNILRYLYRLTSCW